MGKKIRSKPIEWTEPNGKGGCMLMERKKIVKWKNGELHSMEGHVGGRDELGEGRGIVLLEAELVVYFRGEYHF